MPVRCFLVGSNFRKSGQCCFLKGRIGAQALYCSDRGCPACCHTTKSVGLQLQIPCLLLKVHTPDSRHSLPSKEGDPFHLALAILEATDFRDLQVRRSSAGSASLLARFARFCLDTTLDGTFLFDRKEQDYQKTFSTVLLCGMSLY